MDQKIVEKIENFIIKTFEELNVPGLSVGIIEEGKSVSDIIQEFDMLGIINVRVISKGRGGRMREIKLAITNTIKEQAKKIIQEALE